MRYGEHIMSYYFTGDPGKKPNLKKITFRFLAQEETFISDDGVFSKSTLDFGSRVLLETIVKDNLQGSLLDLGCGLGYIGILLKKYHPSLNVTMTDINERAVELAEMNSKLYGQDNTVMSGDGICTDELFDYVVTNPPIRTGKQNVHRLLKEGFDHLKDDGKMYIVMRRQQGAESALKYLNEFARAKVVNRESGYWVICVEHLTN